MLSAVRIKLVFWPSFAKVFGFSSSLAEIEQLCDRYETSQQAE